MVLKCICACVAGAVVLGGVSASAGDAVTQVTGAPYSLMGKRMVFTNWFFVSPGSFAWQNDKGLPANSIGPWGATFQSSNQPIGIRLVAEPASEKVGPLLDVEKPWEERLGMNFSTVIKDGDRYRAWGSWWGRGAYYESKDGLHWERPKLGIVQVNGSSENNLLDMPIRISTVFVDPSAPPAERYKWVAQTEISDADFDRYKKKHPNDWEPRSHRPDANMIAAICGAVSPDGIHWRQLADPLVVEHSDTQVTAYYDQRLRKYVVYTRNYMIGDRALLPGEPAFRPWWEVGRRSIGRTESADFRHFPLSRVIMVPDPSMPPTDLLYMNCYTTIPGAPDHHLMFVPVWHTVDDTVSVKLASSHDGAVWTYVPGPYVLKTSEFGKWDGGCIFPNPNLVELPNGDFALPYTGFIYPHKYPRGDWKFLPGMAVWRKGRLVGLEAQEHGSFSTVPFVAPGAKVRINALTKRAGKILTEAADIDGKPIPGRTFADSDPVIGDQYRTLISWKGDIDLGIPAGKPVVLRFRMEQATIYGLDFE